VPYAIGCIDKIPTLGLQPEFHQLFLVAKPKYVVLRMRNLEVVQNYLTHQSLVHEIVRL